MANLPETPDYPAGVYQLETSDPVLGGPGGIANRQAEQLANRTAWLKAKVDAFLNGTVAVFKATKLATARTLSISGAGSGSVSFDGSANANIALTLADSGAVAGTYPKVTINAKGLVTGGAALAAADIPSLDWSKINSGKPTTLGGYGITDAAPLASPSFTGTPAAPTAAQFDNDTSLATTEFVQRALGNVRKAGARAGNYALTDADTGSLIVAASSATPLTYTMPAIADFPLGACFTVVNLSGQKITLAPNGTEKFIGNLDRSGLAASYMVESGDTCTVTKYQGGLWLVSSVGGTMPALLAVNGYERRPSGVIEQWGNFAVPAGATGAVSAGAAWEFTLPTTFPNGCFQVVASFANPNAGTTGAEVSGNKIYLKNSHTATQTVRWMAKGN